MQNLESIFPKKGDIPAEYNLSGVVNQSEYLINGEIRKWTGNHQDVYSPIFIDMGDTPSNYIGCYPLMEKKQALDALDAAVEAYQCGQGEWPTMSVEKRIDCFYKFVKLMVAERDSVVKLLMWEIGKSLPDSEKEFDRTVDYIIGTIEALKNLDRDSSRLIISQGIIAQIRRAPLGVVLCMGPFNYPLNETFCTLISALIMGNTIIFKQPRYGVLLHYPLLNAFKEAFPKGVVNTVYGRGEKVAGPLLESGKVNALAFIGSSKVADKLKKQHPIPHRLKSILGLEAKNPGIVLHDADIDEAVKECVLGALSFNGQRCTALKIIFVNELIIDEFLEKFIIAVENLKIGMPWEKNVTITPLPEPNKIEYLTELIKDAESFGAKVMNPSGGIFNKSCFFPAILYNVNKKMRIYREEQFGPLVPIVSFKDINEPLDYVLNSNYGQQASIFGKDSDLIAKLIDSLVYQVSRVNINSQCQRGPDNFPFTGRKDSAEGTLSISDALKSFSIRALVATKETETNKSIIREIVKEDKSNFLTTDFIL